MDLYSMVTGLIGQEGRRGALMLSMSCNHPDIEDFISVKNNLDKVTYANISVRITDDFMQSVLNDSDYKLSYTRKSSGEKIEKTIKARDLFHKFCENNWNNAEPGMLFWDTICNWNLLANTNDFEFASTNPCVTGDTLIQTVEGYIPIKELVGKTPYVYCMDDENGGKLTIKQATKVWVTRKNAKLVKVVTGKGSITCTPDHKIFTTNRGWVEAQNLHNGDKIKGLNRQTTGHKYCSVGLSGDKYEKEHRFITKHFFNIDNKDVHHLNNDGFDNRLSNLEVIEHNKHSVISNTGRNIAVKRNDLGQYVEKPVKTKRQNKNLCKKVGTNWFVKEVISLDYEEEVYDMTVPEAHNFIANDMVVHNCAEEPLPSGGSCLLGSMNLAEYVTNKTFDFGSFEHDVRIAVKALNQVLDEGLPLHPLQEQRDSVSTWRQIGLGIMGLADMLIKLEITYGSDEAVDICKKIGKSLSNAAIQESAILAKTQGTYVKYNAEDVLSTSYFNSIASNDTRELVEKYGLCNSQLLTIAPTGTLSTMLGISGGIEPIFANSYTRTTKSLHNKDVDYKVYTPIVKKYMEANCIFDEKDLPKWFVTSHTIPYIERISMQKSFQTYIDASISSTINLSEDTSVEDIEKLYIEAWQNGLKGVTVFRDNCKRIAILNEPSQKSHETSSKIIPRGTIVKADDNVIGLKRKLTTGCGSLHCTAFFDPASGKLMETYFNKGSTGGCNQFMIGLSRMISLLARSGVNIDDIIDQLNSCGNCPSYAVRTATKHDTSKGSCCPIAIGIALKDMCKEVQNYLINNDVELNKENENTAQNNSMLHKCPQCGENTLVYEAGCSSCKSCGYSKCG